MGNHRRNPRKSEHVAVLIRITEADKDWLERVCAENGISRDNIMRLILSSARATWDEFGEQAKQSLFGEIKVCVEEAAQAAIRKAVEASPAVKVERALRSPPPRRR